MNQTLIPFLISLMLLTGFTMLGENISVPDTWDSDIHGEVQLADFSFDASTGTVTEYTGAGGDVVIPAQINGAAVKHLGSGLFYSNTDVVSVQIPEGVTSISNTAFYYCENLTQVSMPGTLEFIGDYAFYSCGALETVEIPAAVAAIGEDAFRYCTALRQITFTGALPALGKDALAFEADAGTLRVVVPSDEEAAYAAALGYDCIPGPPAIRHDYSVPDADLAFDAGTGTITAYYGEAIRADLPAEIQGVPVTAIGAAAFQYDSAVKLVTVPEGVVRIENEAFASSTLQWITLPSTLKTIGEGAFHATYLSSVDLPAGLESIGKGAFYWTDLTTVTLPEGIVELSEAAFANCPWLESVYLPGTLRRIGARAFADCSSLTYAVFGAGDLPEIAEDAFAACPLTDVDIAHDASKAQENAALEAFSALGLDVRAWRADRPDQPPFPDLGDSGVYFDTETGLVTRVDSDQTEITLFWTVQMDDGNTYDVKGVGEGVFSGSGIRRFFVPRSNQFTTIGARAFENSQLAFIDLFDSVTTIGEGAFRNCVNLTEIVIPESVTHIGDGAFEGCVNLVRVVFKGEVESIGANAFANTGLPLEAPDSSDAAGAFTDRMYVCEKAEANGVSANLSVLGRYDVIFHSDGTASLTIGGAALPASPWQDDGTTITVEFSGLDFVFERTETGFVMNYYNALLLTYEPEE